MPLSAKVSSPCGFVHRRTLLIARLQVNNAQKGVLAMVAMPKV